MATVRIIKDATIVRSEGITRGDVLIEGGRIAQVGGRLARPGAREIAAAGRYLLPGIIDPHVHFREPGPTYKETIGTGSAAAVTGGVTSYLEMPNTAPPAIDQARIDEKRAIAARTSHAHYGFFIGAARDNLEALKSVRGSCGIKIFVGSSTGNLLVDDQETLERIFAETRLPIATHCEDEAMVRANAERLREARDPAVHSRVRTPEAAARSVARIAALAIRHQHRTHILHLSSRAELAALPAHSLVSAEVCIPHLFLDTGDYGRLGTFAKVNPALREPADREAVWEALRGGRFALVATDHAPHTPTEKALGYWEAPSGIPSVENSLPLMLDAVHRGLLTLPQLVALMCEGPARVWGLARKGHIREGYDADLVLVDGACQRVVEGASQVSRAGWSPWDGQSLRGWPVMTLVLGEPVVVGGRLVAPAQGRALEPAC